jgi:dihydroxyacetone kinase-like predicted kinase
MNPSAGELLEGARRAEAGEVILLPNNPNVIPAARQAAGIANGSAGEPAQPLQEPGSREPRLYVVPTRSLPQGLAALLAFNPEAGSEANLSAMEAALSAVRTVEVTRAVRPATIGGLTVEEGQYIGLLDGDLVAAGGSALAALQQALARGNPGEGQLVTLYWGADVGEDGAKEAAGPIRDGFPGVEVEVVYGGQPLYQYVASLE